MWRLMGSDYNAFLMETGLTDQQVKASMAAYDRMPYIDSEHLEVRPSPIDGMGMFSQNKLQAGASIGPVVVAGAIAPCGRFLNHSGTPNARFEATGRDILLRALCDIQADTEVTVDYRQTIAETLRAISS